MNYNKIYVQLIYTRQQNPANTFTTLFEYHHIIPLSEGGKDIKDNVVCLTLKEHIFAHQLLARIYNTRNMWLAAYFMLSTRTNSKNKNLKLSAIARQNYRLLKLGYKSPLKGRKLSEEHKKKISVSTKKAMTQEIKLLISELNRKRKGEIRKLTTKQKIGLALKSRIYVNNGIIEKRVYDIPKGFVKGRLPGRMPQD